MRGSVLAAVYLFAAILLGSLFAWAVADWIPAEYEKVLSRSPQGTKSLAAVLGSTDIVKGTAELLKVLKEAGLDIWREYRTADKEHRQQISDQLDSLKWRSYDKVPALG